MVQDIRYNGYTANPSDYDCTDGELATAINVIPENGALKPVLSPKQILQLGDNDSVIYIHKTSEFTHYIIRRQVDTESHLYWVDSKSLDVINLMYDDFPSGSHTYQNKITIEAIGNVLYVSFWETIKKDSKSVYFVWNSPDYDIYHHFPFTCIEFKLLDKTTSMSCNRTLDVSSVNAHEVTNFMSGEDASGNLLSMASDAAWGVLLSRIAEITAANYFYQPFFVRYAFRLYDGTHTHHSAPVLITPSMTVPLMAGNVTNETDYGTDIVLNFQTVFPYGKLQYRILQPDLDALAKWKNIITHIDIFCSAPIYTYDQSKQIKRWQSGRVYYSKKSIADRFKHLDGTESKINIDSNSDYWKIPEREEKDIEEDICNCSIFYRIASLSIEDIITDNNSESNEDNGSSASRPSDGTTSSDDTTENANTEFKDVPMDDDCLKHLETRETLKDDYNSHCVKVAEYAHTYNNRLNLANVSRKLFPGYPIRSMIQFRNPSGTDNNLAHLLCTQVRIKKQGIDYHVDYYPDIDPGASPIITSPVIIDAIDEYFPRFLFYPDPDAYEIQFHSKWNADGSTTSRKYTVPLKPHNTLNGAYYFRGLDFNADVPAYNDREQCILPYAEGKEYVIEQDKIYSSETNNPFIFDVKNIYTAGIGAIYGISTAAKALSQGQFGQYPLYAFTSEGVWALEVSNTGTYSAKQPITRDVVINPDSITQIDNAVLFASDRGIMLLSGPSVQCISDSINAEDLFGIDDLPKSDALINIFNSNTDDVVSLDKIALLPFSEFIKGCRMIYDYTNQRIIVYNPDVKYAYVYSLKSQGWGMILSDIASNVNSYPDALAMTNDNKLVDFSKTSANGSQALIVTRPFKLGSPDIFKTIDTVIQRGHFRSSHVKQILYASNDLYNWHIVWSSTDRYMRGFSGSPYKFFRLALVCDFDKSESISGFSVQFAARMSDQLR